MHLQIVPLAPLSPQADDKHQRHNHDSDRDIADRRRTSGVGLVCCLFLAGTSHIGFSAPSGHKSAVPSFLPLQSWLQGSSYHSHPVLKVMLPSTLARIKVSLFSTSFIPPPF